MSTTSKQKPKPKRNKNAARQSAAKDGLLSSTLSTTQRDLADDEGK
jgi:hypothetical protein